MERVNSILSWVQRHAIAIFLTIALSIFLLIMGVIYLSTSMLSNVMKSFPPYQQALENLNQNHELADRLGRPIQPGSFIHVSIHEEGGTGNANFSFKVQGSKKHGTVHIQAIKEEHKWIYQKQEIEFAGDSNRVSFNSSLLVPSK